MRLKTLFCAALIYPQSLPNAQTLQETTQYIENFITYKQHPLFKLADPFKFLAGGRIFSATAQRNKGVPPVVYTVKWQKTQMTFHKHSLDNTYVIKFTSLEPYSIVSDESISPSGAERNICMIILLCDQAEFDKLIKSWDHLSLLIKKADEIF